MHGSRLQMLRRWLVIFAIALWQGGFLFYALIVVPLGTDVLGSTTEQGAITRRVTHWLNLLGVPTLALLAWELLATYPRSEKLTLPWTLWLLLLAAQYLLICMHQVLEYMLGPGPQAGGFVRPFYRLHGIYLWISTGIWLAAWILMWRLLLSWHTFEKK